jgi:MYXO-CTERM domain-containing protein
MMSNVTKTIGAGVLTLSMAVLPLTVPATAQVTDAPRTDAPLRTTAYDRNDVDWGWLGLVGLFGLAGLAGRRRDEEPTRYRDPNTPGATSSSYRD